MTVPDWSPGRIVCGRYTIQGVLARTPLTRTYAALTEPNREVVIRVFGPEAAPSLDVLSQRLALLASLPEPAVVRVLEISVDPASGARFVATERCRHPSLATLVELCPLAPAEGLAFATKLAAALDAAHSRGIAHLGLRPANVFVGPMPQSTVQVADFAIPRLGPVTFEQARWLSPEQLLERPGTPASDVLSFALIVFHALTGKSYWSASSIEELSREHHARRRPASQRAAELGVTLPAGMDTAFDAALALDPARRPQRASGFAASLSSEVVARSDGDVAPPPLDVFGPLHAIEAQRVFEVAPQAQAPAPAPAPVPVSANSGNTWPQAFEPLPPPPYVPPAHAYDAPTEVPSTGAVDVPRSGLRRPSRLTIALSAVAALLFVSAGIIFFVALRSKKPKPVIASTAPSASVVAAAASAAPTATRAPDVLPAPVPSAPLPSATVAVADIVDAAPPVPPSDAIDPKQSELLVMCEPVPCKVVLVDRQKAPAFYPDAITLPPGQHGVGVNGEGYWGDWKLVETKGGERTVVTFDLKPKPPGAPEPKTPTTAAPPFKKPCGKFVEHCK